jgi:hypothetical protein
MKIKITEQAIKESHFVKLKNREEIQICAYCDSWWIESDFPRHNIDCDRPYQGP